MKGNFYDLNFNRNLLEILGTLDFKEIWPASSLLHLIARINFHQKWIKNLNSTQNGKFD
jgi:hypothetical protein